MRWREWLVTGIFLALLLGAWQLASSTGIISPLRFPSPLTVATTGVTVMEDGYPTGIPLWVHAVSSLRLIVTGYLIGSALALILSLPIAWYSSLRMAAIPVIDLMRGIPALAWIPLAIALFGIGDTSKLFVVVYATFWTTATYCVDGIVRVDPRLVRVGRFCGASTVQLLRTVLLPAALPSVFIGLRVSYAIAFAVVLAAEMIGSFKGLGYLIQDARGVYRTDVVLVGIITIGLLAQATSMILQSIERRILRWRPATEAAIVYEV
jgi:sulfonate transport system permease protein